MFLINNSRFSGETYLSNFFLLNTLISSSLVSSENTKIVNNAFSMFLTFSKDNAGQEWAIQTRTKKLV